MMMFIFGFFAGAFCSITLLAIVVASKIADRYANVAHERGGKD